MSEHKHGKYNLQSGASNRSHQTKVLTFFDEFLISLMASDRTTVHWNGYEVELAIYIYIKNHFLPWPTLFVTVKLSKRALLH